MRNSSSDSAFYRLQASASVTLSPLDELLTHSIRLRDLYRSARLQSADMPSSRLRLVFDDHYKEQLRLVDVLVDRLRMLGGVHHISAGEFLNTSEVFHGLRSHRMRNRLFRDLLESHESILTAARPSGNCDEQDDVSWIRDFAVGQVVISNELQSQIICELMLGRVEHPSVQTPAAMALD